MFGSVKKRKTKKRNPGGGVAGRHVVERHAGRWLRPGLRQLDSVAAPDDELASGVLVTAVGLLWPGVAD